jgi:hypothetical protein
VDRPIITRADLPSDVIGEIRAPAPPAAPPGRAPIELVFDRMVKHRESFWSAVYPAFMTRDLTRSDLRFIVRRGLQETAGSYKLLVELLNMKPTDYKRFLNFLRKHECQVPFERFRSARARPSAADPFPDSLVADPTTPPVLDDVASMSDLVSGTPAGRQ